MRDYLAKVTSKGQLTLPVAVRRRLRIETGDRVAVVVDGENVATSRRVEHAGRSVRGMIPGLSGFENGDFDDLIEEAWADHADELMRRRREGTR